MSEVDDHIYDDDGDGFVCWCGEVHAVTEHDKTMQAAREHMTKQSRGENGKKRKNSVERYLYQFMRGYGQTATKAYKDGWDRIFGKQDAGREDMIRDMRSQARLPE